MAPRSSTIHSERRAQLATSPEELWRALEELPSYRAWWPWLRRFDADALADDARWTCTVKPPLPYTVSFDLVLRDVVPGRSVAADLSGEIVGSARIDLHPHDVGTELHLVADLSPASRFLRGLSIVAGPVARYGHDHIVDRALAQFGDHAI